MSVTLQEVIREGNKSPKVKLKRLMTVKKYYLSMYRANMLKLYALCYINDPTRFNKPEIIQNLIDLNVIGDVTTCTGMVELTATHVKFAIYRNKGNSEVHQMLSILYEVLKYKELSEQVDALFSEFDFYGVDSAKVKVQMYQKGAMVVQKGLKFDEAKARIISPFEEETHSVSVNDKLWGICLRYLGIPEEDYEKDGLFDGNLTHEEEVECAEGILNGCFKVTGGIYTSNLENWLLSHRWSSTAKFTLDTKGLYDYIYCEDCHEVEAVFNQVLNTIQGKIIAVQGDKIYYNIPRTCIELPYGVFAILCEKDNEDETLLAGGQAVFGYTGEVYTEERLVEDEVTYIGCPILIYSSLTKPDYVYDLEQTDVKSKTWFEENSQDFELVFSDSEADSLPPNPFEEGTLEWELYDGYKEAQRDALFLTRQINVHAENDLQTACKKVYKVLEGMK